MEKPKVSAADVAEITRFRIAIDRLIKSSGVHPEIAAATFLVMTAELYRQTNQTEQEIVEQLRACLSDVRG